ncbi:MAG: flagellar biosynthetic protein FliP [Firmicutes bacterium HGW-Firmicutes-5]|nr:MAG: flagellar biosynthetic protein FliP [Firmicutes bacterium HGW-Firmicutes-5]
MKANNKKRALTIMMVLAMFLLFFGNTTMRSHATETNNAPIPFSFDLSVGAAEDGQDVVSSIQILVILTLMTLFIMSPVISQINVDAMQPYAAGEISQEVAIERGLAPIREFMLGEVNPKDLALFMDIAKIEAVETYEEIPTEVIIPAFIISELRAAFIIGFLIYIPFIVIDMVVASVLMSMGMMMLPPVMISMPFKLLLFLMADGWGLIIGRLVETFYD